MRNLDATKDKYPEKFQPLDSLFCHIHKGDRIFVGTGCGEPQYLVQALSEPVFLSQIPSLFCRKLISIDVAHIQKSLPDDKGYLSLGVSVDVTKAAAETASLVITQVNVSFQQNSHS